MKFIVITLFFVFRLILLVFRLIKIIAIQIAYHPLLGVCLGGMWINPSWAWIWGGITYLLLENSLNSQAGFKFTIRSLGDLQKDFLDEASEFEFEELDNSEFIKLPDFKHIVWLQNLAKRFGRDANQVQFNQPGFKGIPLRIFLAKKKGFGLVGAAKAYPNVRGPGFIFLFKRLENMSLFDKFVLLHEIQHTSFQGGLYLVNLIKLRTLLMINLLVFSFVVPSIVHCFFVIIYYFVNQMAFSNEKGKDEIQADNRAIQNIESVEEQKEVVSDLMDILSDQILLANSESQLNDRVIAQGRLNHLMLYKKALASSVKIPAMNYLHYPYFRWLSIPFSILFFYWGTLLNTPPYLLLTLLTVYAVCDHLFFFTIRAKMTHIIFNNTINKIEKHLST